MSQNQVCLHFGHCEAFALFEVDPEACQIVSRTDLPAPPHQPGLLPPWLAEKGATVIIAGGMGQRAQALFAQQEIEVFLGAPANQAPEALVQTFLAGKLESGPNPCDH